MKYPKQNHKKKNQSFINLMDFYQLTDGNWVELVTDHNPKLISLLVLKWCSRQHKGHPQIVHTSYHNTTSIFCDFLFTFLSMFPFSPTFDVSLHFHINVSLLPVIFSHSYQISRVKVFTLNNKSIQSQLITLNNIDLHLIHTLYTLF